MYMCTCCRLCVTTLGALDGGDVSDVRDATRTCCRRLLLNLRLWLRLLNLRLRLRLRNRRVPLDLGRRMRLLVRLVQENTVDELRKAAPLRADRPHRDDLFVCFKFTLFEIDLFQSIYRWCSYQFFEWRPSSSSSSRCENSASSAALDGNRKPIHRYFFCSVLSMSVGKSLARRAATLVKCLARPGTASENQVEYPMSRRDAPAKIREKCESNT